MNSLALRIFFLFVLACCALFGLNVRRVHFMNDGALAAAVGDGIRRGELPLAGPPAALAGRHFGPWYFYFEAFTGLAGAKKFVHGVYFASLLKACSLLLLLGTVKKLF